MAYCRNCGKEINENQDYCMHCGSLQTEDQSTYVSDEGEKWWCALGFCVPLVGLILYIVWKNDRPNNAKMAGTGALISVILSVVFYIVYFVLLGFSMNMR